MSEMKFDIKKQSSEVQNWTLINFFAKFRLFSIFRIFSFLFSRIERLLNV
jgi:hypothetical protein